MKPDPAFTAFFAGEFQSRLDRVDIPGLPGASWDRRAAFLLWLAEGNTPSASEPAPPPEPDEDIFG